MHLCGETLDDLLRSVFSRILKRGLHVSASRGDNREVFCVLLELSNPLARLSRTESKGRPFSALGELLWYLSGSDDRSFIGYYIRDYESGGGDAVWGAYGPRLSDMRGIDQLAQVRELLRRRQSSRRAVIQLYR